MNKADRTNTRYANYSGYTPNYAPSKREPIGAGWWLLSAVIVGYFVWQFIR